MKLSEGKEQDNTKYGFDFICKQETKINNFLNSVP